MIDFAKFARPNNSKRIRRTCCAAVVLAVLASAAVAQTVPPVTTGYTPIGIAPGAPAGSYPLSGFDVVNLYNGNLNVRLPLLQIGGRGSAGYTMTLGIEQRWLMQKFVDCGGPICFISYVPIANWWSAIRAGYGPGVLQGRFGFYEEDNNPCTPVTGAIKALARFTFTEPDGTEHELIDTVSDGQPDSHPCPVIGGFPRGTVFRSYDGSAMTFISDTPIVDGTAGVIGGVVGHVMLRDGTRYDIQDGMVTRIRDRNGNVVTLLYAADPTNPGHVTDKLLEVTDPLNRKVHISYHTNTTTNPYDQITFTGFGGAARTIKIKFSMLESALGANETLKTFEQLFPAPPDGLPNEEIFNREVISELQLPNVGSGFVGRYKFQYNAYSEIARIELPTGGAYEYTWGAGSETTTGGVIGGPFEFGFLNQSMGIYRRVIEKRIFKENGLEEGRMKFLETFDQANFFTVVTTEQRGPGANGALFARDKHYLGGHPGLSQVSGSGVNGGPRPTDYSDPLEGSEFKTEALDTAQSATVLRRAENQYQARNLRWANLQMLSNNSHLIETVSTNLDPTLPMPLVSRRSAIDPVTEEIGFDNFDNQTDVWEYDFGQGSPGPLTRHTHTDYVRKNPQPNGPNYQANLDIHIRNLTRQVAVFDASGTEQSRTSFEYDNFTNGLATCLGITGHDDAVYTTGYVTRGNLTAITKWVLPSTQLTTRMQYDVAGNVKSITDAKGNPPTLIDYSDAYGSPDANARGNETPLPPEIDLNPAVHTYAFATKVTNALSQIVYAQFDYYTGKPVNTEDANAVITKGSYNDLLERPKLVVSAVGVSALERQTSFTYDDVGRMITTHSDQTLSGDGVLTTTALYDGLGRTNETRTSDPQGTVFTEQEFDALGRVNRVFNPYRTTSESTYGTTVTTYDVLGRVSVVQTFDRLNASTGMMSTAYDGARVLMTDQAGKQRISKSDGLGRLTDVWEIKPSDPATEAVTFPNHSEVLAGYRTRYSYDVLDDLISVAQQIGTAGSTQSRYFMYDSLKRLIRTRNPEQDTNATLALADPLTGNGDWCMKYTYDENSNLLTRTDPRGTNGLTATSTYDALNRVTGRTYTNDPQNTPAVSYVYDSQGLPQGAPPAFDRGSSVGRLVAVNYGGGSAGTYRGYDAVGRVVRQVQQTDGINYQVNAGYNRAGELTSEVYPAVPGFADRRTVSFSYDSAGRMSSLTSAATSYAGAAGVSSMAYAAPGGVASETYDNTLVHAITYNSRLQPDHIKLGTSGVPTSLLDIAYGYGPVDANNGNVRTITYNGGGLSYTQSFDYDELNRLTTAQENTGASWTETNAYDRYGNRWTVSGVTPSLTFDANNRITGFTYDKAGSLTNFNSLVCQYDAENRQTSLQMEVCCDGPSSTAVYDGEGNRVKRSAYVHISPPPPVNEFRFVYDMFGRLISEYNAVSGALSKESIYSSSGLVAAIEPANGTRYVTADHLGSPRVVTNASQAVVSRHDYMPFGAELLAGIGGRTAGMGYGATDGVRQQFTQKERDNESGLDYFGARYYSSAQGRFTSIDPGPFTPADPQNWNRNAYVQNNPLKYIDPTGKELYITGSDAGYLVAELERFTGYKLNRDPKTGLVTVDNNAKRRTRGTSENLANKLNEVIGDKEARVSIGTGRNVEGARLDNYATKTIDIADYNVIKRDAPALAATELGHVLEEYYVAAKEGLSDTMGDFRKAHDSAKEFESSVLSDFTRRLEQPRQEGEVKFEGTSTNSSSTVRFMYTTVTYDIQIKTRGNNPQVIRVIKYRGQKQD